MEAKKEEFIIISERLEEMGVSKDWVETFNGCFPNGIAKDSEIDKLLSYMHYEDIDSSEFIYWLLDNSPYTGKPLIVFDDVLDETFHLGDIHVNNDIDIEGNLYIKGKLKVDGKLTSSITACINSYQTIANEINITNRTAINSKKGVEAKSINSSNGAQIFGNTKSEFIKLNQSYIDGNVDADEIINDGGLIRGDVNTFTIENINGGRVKGKISYKSPDEHK